MLETLICLLKDELNFLKRKKLTRYDMEIVSCKVADAKFEVNNFVDGLHRETLDLYVNF